MVCLIVPRVSSLELHIVIKLRYIKSGDISVFHNPDCNVRSFGQIASFCLVSVYSFLNWKD